MTKTRVLVGAVAATVLVVGTVAAQMGKEWRSPPSGSSGQ